MFQRRAWLLKITGLLTVICVVTWGINIANNGNVPNYISEVSNSILNNDQENLNGIVKNNFIPEYCQAPNLDSLDINDPYVCVAHGADGFVLTPIFHEDELVAWCATMTHLMDVGGADPGGFTPSAREVYQEGIRIGGIKIVEAGKIRRDVIDTIVNMTRVPGIVELDLRAEIAAGTTMKRRLKELIEHYGLETFKVFATPQPLNLEPIVTSRGNDDRQSRGALSGLDLLINDIYGEGTRGTEGYSSEEISGSSINYNFKIVR